MRVLSSFNHFIILFLLIILQPNLLDHGRVKGCTIGVALGKATSDGRPLLWKTRDNDEAPDNTVKYDTGSTYKFIYVATAGQNTSSWMGVNEYGFAIINSLASDMKTNKTGPGNGQFMKSALGTCKTVADFEKYLQTTNITGRATQANFGVIDATGAAVIFETGGNVYYKFDASETEHGYVIRTNFAFNGGGDKGTERYKRSSNLIYDFYSGDTLNYKSIIRYQMRDFSDDMGEPVSIPFIGSWSPGIPDGYIPCEKSICRTSSVSAAVIHGVMPEESTLLSTMWTMLGHTATTISIPFWPVGTLPVEVSGNPKSILCNEANDIRKLLFDLSGEKDFINTIRLKDGKGGGLFPYLFNMEDRIFDETEHFLDSLRELDHVPVNTMKQFEVKKVSDLLVVLKECKNKIISTAHIPVSLESVKVYPNPTSDKVYIDCAEENNLKMQVYDFVGSFTMQQNLNNGINELNLSPLSKGVYVFRLSDDVNNFHGKLIKN